MSHLPTLRIDRELKRSALYYRAARLPSARLFHSSRIIVQTGESSCRKPPPTRKSCKAARDRRWHGIIAMR